MKKIITLMIIATAMLSCKKETITHTISFECHSDSVGFELLYIGSTNDSNFITVNDTHVVVYPFTVPKGFQYQAVIVAHDYSSKVNLELFIDGVATVPQSVLPIDSFALTIEGMVN